ncbi:MAG: nickel pincer cofactor biosynthesis protein LarB [Desulfovibrio sp.]|nr:nickel pincer cofactor biosynthesis protein LarB [Desulfovibrio sp.]
MSNIPLLQILEQVAAGGLKPEAALGLMGTQTVCDALHGLTLDPQRALRTGLAEVVLAQGKSDNALVAAVEGLARHGAVLVSRVSPAQAALLEERFSEGRFWPEARIFSLGGSADFARAMQAPWQTAGEILVVTAGAADISVALEAYCSLAFWGKPCGLITDVGVAGLHRLTPHVEALRKARIIIAVAGMEGALPGVLAGLVFCPVLAVPTSVGYGVGTGGFAALSTMLSTCVPGVATLNIDNGFGAAAFAAKLLNRD